MSSNCNICHYFHNPKNGIGRSPDKRSPKNKNKNFVVKSKALPPSFEAEVHPVRDRNNILITIRWKVNVLCTIETVKFVIK